MLKAKADFSFLVTLFSESQFLRFIEVVIIAFSIYDVLLFVCICMYYVLLSVFLKISISMCIFIIIYFEV